MRIRWETLATRADDVPGGKVCLVGDAVERGPSGALTRVRVAVIGADMVGLASTNLRDEARAWFDGAECAELRHRAALRGGTILLGVRQRHDAARVEHARLDRLHRATFDPDAA